MIRFVGLCADLAIIAYVGFKFYNYCEEKDNYEKLKTKFKLIKNKCQNFDFNSGKLLDAFKKSKES